MFRTGVQMSLLVLLTGCVLFWLSRAGPVREFDDAAGSRLAQLHGWGVRIANNEKWLHRPPQAPLTLVAIDDSSTADHPWPWTPIEYSLFVRAALNFDPEVLVTDEVLDWDRAKLAQGERQKLPQFEKILRDALLRAPKMLLASELGWPEDPNTIPPVREAPLLRNVRGDLREVPEWTIIEHEPKEELRLAATIGFTNLPAGHRAVHTVPLVLRYQGRLVPTLTLQAIVLWQKLSLDDVFVLLGSQIMVGNLRIPIDTQGEMRVNFGTPFAVMNFDRLLLASEQLAAKQKVSAPVEGLSHGVALLARTDKAASQLTLGHGEKGTAGELYAAAIATIQSQAWIFRTPTWVDAIIIGVASLLSAWVPIWRKRKVLLWVALLVVLYGFTAFALFALRSLVLPAALPLGLALFIVLYRAATPENVWKLRRPIIL